MAPFIFAFLFVALGLVGLIVATIKLRRQTGPASSTFGTLSLPASRAVQSHPRNVPAHPRNAPGPFYVLYDCCTACGVPEAMAPDHFAYDAGRNCFVKRQPESPDELEKMLRVIRRQELGCIRYRGTDKQVLRRLAEAGESRHCDAAPPRGAEPVLRNHVSFAAMEPVARGWRGDSRARRLCRLSPSARVRVSDDADRPGWGRSTLLDQLVRRHLSSSDDSIDQAGNRSMARPTFIRTRIVRSHR